MARIDTHPLISIRSSASVQDAARLMADCSISAVGVTGPDGGFAGLLTERDLGWFVAQAKDPKDTSVADIVNDFPIVVDFPIDEAEAFERMRRAHVRHLLVKQGSELRIVSMRDLHAHEESTTDSRWSTAGLVC